MPRLSDPTQKMDKTVKLSLTSELAAKLWALAAIEDKKPAVIVRECVETYMESRAEEISAVLKANEAFQQNLARIRRADAEPTAE